MARKKADYDPRQRKCENEAREIVLEWYKNRNLLMDPKTIFVVWFAYLPSGFKCMLSTDIYKNNFFEVTVNKITGETQCACYERFEYMVKPADHGWKSADIS